MMHAACGGEDDGASRGKGEAHETLASDLEIGQAVGRNLHDAACTGERGGDIEVAVHIEGQALRSSQTLVERAHRSIGIDLVNAVVGTGHEKVSMRTERQVIGGNAGLERGKDKDLLVARDLEDGTVPVTDVET